MSLASRWFRVVGLCAAGSFVACTPGAAGLTGAFGGTLLFVGLLALAAPGRRTSRLGVQSAEAGPPMPCDGYQSTVCEGEHIRTRCCPKGDLCNFRDEVYIACGHGLCTTTGDVGRCATPTPSLVPAMSQADCVRQSGQWELVCANKVVVAGCLPSLPTNYAGPGQNPRFSTCGSGASLLSDAARAGDRCTTHALVEDCFPTALELGLIPCQGTLTDVCIGGKVSEKCLPTHVAPQSPRTWAAATFVTCDDGSCAVGSDKSKVCRL